MLRREPWPVGTPCWLDVMTPDVATTQRFYGALFGWGFRAPDETGYVVAVLDGHAVAGLLPGSDDHPPVWNVYLAVDDLDAAVESVTSAGGEVIITPMDAPGGRLTVCREPTGAVFCLWQARGDVGCEIANEDGTFVWAELLSRDMPGAVEFHRAAFGVTTSSVGTPDNPIVTLNVGDPVANVVGVPAHYPADVPSHWRVYFASDDPDAHAIHARELGGDVMVEPHDTPFGRWALLTDPLGTRFSVITPPA